MKTQKAIRSPAASAIRPAKKKAPATQTLVLKARPATRAKAVALWGAPLPIAWLRKVEGVKKLSELPPESKLEIMGPNPGALATTVYVTGTPAALAQVKEQVAQYGDVALHQPVKMQRAPQ